jgi:molybdenum cofactor synthesis domain-containing protein
VITVSTSAATGGAADESGPILVDLLADAGFTVASAIPTADRLGEIEAALRHEAESGSSLILTTGGTGFSRDDVTPEATKAVIEREAPGLAEAIRADAVKRIPTGILTRGVAGIFGECLIVNLPGSPKGVREAFSAIEPALAHAVEQLGTDGGRDRH